MELVNIALLVQLLVPIVQLIPIQMSPPRHNAFLVSQDIRHCKERLNAILLHRLNLQLRQPINLPYNLRDNHLRSQLFNQFLGQLYSRLDNPQLNRQCNLRTVHQNNQSINLQVNRQVNHQISHQANLLFSPHRNHLPGLRGSHQHSLLDNLVHNHRCNQVYSLVHSPR